jgi:hypothetical protein
MRLGNVLLVARMQFLGCSSPPAGWNGFPISQVSIYRIGETVWAVSRQSRGLVPAGSKLEPSWIAVRPGWHLR